VSTYMIRAPFAVHLHQVKERKQPGGRILREPFTVSHFSGEDAKPIELSDAEALAHIHKLEPHDDSAKALFETYHEKQRQAAEARRRQEREMQGPSLSQELALAMVSVLQEAGVIKPAK